jgi:hypothetical protein
MRVANCANGDIQRIRRLAVHFQKPSIPTARHRLVEAIKKSLTLPETLM